MQRRSVRDLLCVVVVTLSLVSCVSESGTLPPPKIETAEMSTSMTAGESSETHASDAAAVGTRSPVAAPTPSNRGRVSLVDHFDWIPVASEQDPFDDRQADSACALDGVTVTLLAGELSYDVETGKCSYITATQPSQQPLELGDLVKVRLWHFELTAPSTGDGHAVLEIDGERVLDVRVAIPSPGGLIKAERRIDRPVRAGAPIHFHLHNHGQNSWALVEVSTGP